MEFNDHDRKQLRVDATFSEDPSSATAVLAIDATEYPVTWSGAATQSGSTWTRSGTTPHFAGPAHAAPNGAPVLAREMHTVELRTTIGSTTIVTRLPNFWVR